MKNDSVAFIAVTSDEERRVTAFLNNHNLHLPVYLNKGNPPKDLPVVSFPTTYILDRQGAAKFRSTEPANWDDEGVRAFIRALETS